jgi:hypothetical protein
MNKRGVQNHLHKNFYKIHRKFMDYYCIIVNCYLNNKKYTGYESNSIKKIPYLLFDRIN